MPKRIVDIDDHLYDILINTPFDFRNVSINANGYLKVSEQHQLIIDIRYSKPYVEPEDDDCISKSSLKESCREERDKIQLDYLTTENANKDLHSGMIAGVLKTESLIDEAQPISPRPRGHWIKKVERRGCYVGNRTVYSYTCPFCNVKEFAVYDYCHCGADLRGKEDEQ